MKAETQRHLHQSIQAYVARSSVTASAARGQGAPGIVAAARHHLATLHLDQFAVRSEAAFQRVLNRQTVRLRDVIPSRGRSWGLARKLLNIFLRNALYTSYLRDASNLGIAERWYEVPLDGIVARRLRHDCQDMVLPRWRGVQHLTPELSAAYQEACRLVAKRHGIAPVHLDAIYWGIRL